MVGRIGSLGHLFDQIQVKYVKNIVMTITIEVTVAKTGPRTVGYAMRTLWTRHGKEKRALQSCVWNEDTGRRTGRGGLVCVSM